MDHTISRLPTSSTSPPYCSSKSSFLKPTYTTSSFKIDPSYLGNYALRTAARDGKADLVELLLEDKRVDPAAKNNWALIASAQNGHAGM